MLRALWRERNSPVKVTAVDRWAYSNAGFLHHAPLVTKTLGAAVLLTMVVATWSPLILVAVVVAIYVLAAVGRLPLRLMATLALYPMAFSALLALTGGFGLGGGTAIVLKAYAAASVALLVGLTTPYPAIFGALGRVLPPFLNDALLMTYRSLFILGDTMGNLLNTVHLRGALSIRNPMGALRSIGLALGNLVLATYDLAQADYDIMRVRGYHERIRISGAAPAGVSPDSEPKR